MPADLSRSICLRLRDVGRSSVPLFRASFACCICAAGFRLPQITASNSLCCTTERAFDSFHHALISFTTWTRRRRLAPIEIPSTIDTRSLQYQTDVQCPALRLQHRWEEVRVVMTLTKKSSSSVKPRQGKFSPPQNPKGSRNRPPKTILHGFQMLSYYPKDRKQRLTMIRSPGDGGASAWADAHGARKACQRGGGPYLPSKRTDGCIVDK